jgi:molecular chaperone DnaK
VEVHVLQGEREMARDNRTLGKFHLMGVPPAPRGIPQIEVSFDIDANGIVNVSAKDLATGKEQAITITSSSGLDKTDVEKMVTEAEENRDGDRKAREAIESRNRLDTLVYSTERHLNESRDKLDAGVVSDVEAALEDAKKILADEGAQAEAMKQAEDRLTQASHRLAESLYQTSQASSGPAGPTEAGPEPDISHAPPEDVVDAEYTEVQ